MPEALRSRFARGVVKKARDELFDLIEVLPAKLLDRALKSEGASGAFEGVV